MAWKEVLRSGAQSAIEYFMPDLAADMDPTRALTGIPGMELYPEGADSDKGMRVSDVFFDVPMRDGENGNVALFTEQQDEEDEEFALRVFETYVRMRERRRVRTTGFVIYTGNSPNVDTYSESCYGLEVSMKFRTFHLLSMSVDELRADRRPFGHVVLAARLSLDAGDNVELREKYAAEILNTTDERDYGRDKRLFILDFSRRIFRLNASDISPEVKEAYKMQTVSLQEYAQQVTRELDKEEGREEGREEGKKEGKKEGREDKAFEIARSMFADGFSVDAVRKYTGLDEKELLAVM
jgi:predicted transposase YdaD